MNRSTKEATAREVGGDFPPFDLVRLLTTVFRLEGGESFGVFTDLPDARLVDGLAYRKRPGFVPQKHAYGTIHRGIVDRAAELGGADAAFYAYEETGGSNLDLPGTVRTPEGETLDLRAALERHEIALFMGRWSATAPLTALAKEMGFRGATMHGTNDRVLATGLAVDYEQVSARAERLRLALTRADAMRLDWSVGGYQVSLRLDLGRQEAQKSHGLVRAKGEVANLPAGEVYYVPTGGEGFLPRKFEDDAGTVAIFEVKARGLTGTYHLIKGDRAVAEVQVALVREDPNAGQLTELGLGTQSLPWAHTDIQDEKILGTAHVATGRSDHLGGDIDSSSFRDKRNASHNDILYTPEKTPEVALRSVRMLRDGEETLILEDYAPAEFLRRAL